MRATKRVGLTLVAVTLTVGALGLTPVSAGQTGSRPHLPSGTEYRDRSVSGNAIGDRKRSCPCYYTKAMSRRAVAIGLTAVLSQAQPTIGVGDTWSRTEIEVGSADEHSFIGFGWMVFEGFNGDLRSHIYAQYTGNGRGCTDCKFVRNPKAKGRLGDVVSEGPATYAIRYLTNPSRWQLSYNGSSLGYFPESIFRGKFTKVGLVSAFGQVLSSSTTKPRTQMGNGILGTKPGAAKISGFSLIGATTIKPLVYDNRDVPTLYKIGAHSPRSCRSNCFMYYGGPGYTGT